jgi:peptide deformylase
MALLPILQFPDPKLKLVAKQVDVFNADLNAICRDLLETMYEFHGVGLAATQVNIQQRIIAIDISEDRNQGLCLINPEITHSEGDLNWEEGCLSFPGVFAKVRRKENITVEYYDLKGKLHTMDASELTAICIQHEIDHLDGITFYDHLSPLKQKMLRKKLEKQYDKSL